MGEDNTRSSVIWALPTSTVSSPAPAISSAALAATSAMSSAGVSQNSQLLELNHSGIRTIESRSRLRPLPLRPPSPLCRCHTGAGFWTAGVCLACRRAGHPRGRASAPFPATAGNPFQNLNCLLHPVAFLAQLLQHLGDVHGVYDATRLERSSR